MRKLARRQDEVAFLPLNGNSDADRTAERLRRHDRHRQRDHVVANQRAEAPTAEAPTAEAPTAEAPTAEAPTAEAPTAEAPTADSPLAKPTSFATKPTAPTKATSEPAADSAAGSGTCTTIASSDAAEGQLSIPSISLDVKYTGTGFPNDSNKLLLSQFGDAALLASSVDLSFFPEDGPQVVATEYAQKLLAVDGWKSALSGNVANLGNGRYASLFSDGTSDSLLLSEPPATMLDLLRTLGAPEKDLAELEAKLGDAEAVQVRYDGKGLVKALCAGAVPEVFNPASGASVVPGNAPAAAAAPAAGSTGGTTTLEFSMPKGTDLVAQIKASTANRQHNRAAPLVAHDQRRSRC